MLSRLSRVWLFGTPWTVTDILGPTLENLPSGDNLIHWDDSHSGQSWCLGRGRILFTVFSISLQIHSPSITR